MVADYLFDYSQSSLNGKAVDEIQQAFRRIGSRVELATIEDEES